MNIIINDMPETENVPPHPKSAVWWGKGQKQFFLFNYLNISRPEKHLQAISDD